MLGEKLGAYRIESELGSGGMGKVYRAEVEREVAGLAPGDRVALKVIHPHLLEGEGYFKRFLREAEVGRSVRHRNVVRCFDADALRVRGEQVNFLVMEFVEGQTLRDLLDELVGIPEELCRHIGREVANGLLAIHEAGVVHRDIKPDNVLITPEHEVKIMDLGLARVADAAVRLSQSGAFVGSVHYAAPEQIAGTGDDLDGRADLHATGVMLYELAAGDHPYLGDGVHETIRRVLEGEPRRLGERCPQISPFFEEVVHRLLAKNREERFASAGELLHVLEVGEASRWWTDRARAIRVDSRRPLRRIAIPRETAVYGREDELSRLRSLYTDVRSGNGRVLVLTGEAGIGKTRLLDEFVARLRADGEDPYFLVGSYPPAGAATAAGAFSTAYREHFGGESLEAILADHLPGTPVLVPAFASLLRGEPTPKDEEPLTRDSIHTVFVHATRAMAADRPTIVAIEDLHFAPEEGRALFAALALAVPGHRIFLIGTTRPGLPGAWGANLERLDQTAGLVLDRLGPKDLGRLLEDAFRSERLASELGYRILTKSDGNPFFVFEIIRGLREGQFITRREDGSWMTTKVIRDIAIPSSVLELVQARLVDLDEDERNLLELASCIGFEFGGRLLAAVLGTGRIPTLQRLGHLEKDHRLVRAAGPRFVFDHHQVQEALYAGISQALREEYHAAIGAAIEDREGSAREEPNELEGPVAVDLADHFLRGGAGRRAARYLDAALDHLELGHLNGPAADLADRALSVPGLYTGDPRAELLLRRVRRLDALGRRDEEAAALEETVALVAGSEDGSLRARAYLMRGAFHQVMRHDEEARPDLDEALRLARDAADRETECDALLQIGGLCRHQGGFDEALTCFERASAVAEEGDNARSHSVAQANIGIVHYYQARYEQATESYERALAIARAGGERVSELTVAGNLGLVLHRMGRTDEAQRNLEAWLSVSREIGSRINEAAATGNLGTIHLTEGRFEEAREAFERNLAISREIGNRRGEAGGTGNLGNVLKSDGRLGDALRHFEEARDLSREIRDPQAELIGLETIGTTRLALGDVDGAEAVFEEGLGISRKMGVDRVTAYLLAGLATVRTARGDLDGAAAGHRDVIERLRGIGDEDGLAHILVELGVVRMAAGDDEEATAALEEACGLTVGSHRGLLARAWLAVLTGDATAALELLKTHRARLPLSVRMEARYALYEATKESAHLDRAHRLLETLREHAPEDRRRTMIENVPLHRRIEAAFTAR